MTEISQDLLDKITQLATSKHQTSPETLSMIKDMDKKLEMHVIEHKFTIEKINDVNKKIDGLVVELKNQNKENENKFVKKEEFKPIVLIVYGMVGFILLAFLSSVVALVFLQ